METEAKLRRLHHIEKMTIKALARQTGMSRNTIRRVLRADKAGHFYQRKIQPMPALGAYIDTLIAWLETDAHLAKKERRTAVKYHTQLKALGYQGSYDSVQRYVKSWRQQQKMVLKQTYIPLVFAPGEAYQFDWSEEIVELGGKVNKVQIAHFRLCYSRKSFLIAYLRESQEMLFDAHNKAFAFFGGVCERGIYDNMKTAVTFVFVGKERLFNRRFLSLMDHYLIEPVACTPSAPWEKGQVENQVNNMRDWLFRPQLKCDSLAQLNTYLQEQCELIANERTHPIYKDKLIAEVFAQERLSLRAYSSGPFEAYKEESLRVSSTCLIHYDRNRYSVDCGYANQRVIARAYTDKIMVFGDEQVIAEHPRQFGRDHTVFNPWHYVPLLERKPGALRNGAPFKDWGLPRPIEQVKKQLLKRKGGDKECVAILTAIRQYSMEAVEVACELALADKTVSKDVILNSLSRLRQEHQPDTIATPLSLTLAEEPTTDCAYYNRLLQEMHHVSQPTM